MICILSISWRSTVVEKFCSPVSGRVFAHDAVEPRHETRFDDGQLPGLLPELVVGLVKLRPVVGAFQTRLHRRHVAEGVRFHVFTKVEIT